MGKDYELCKSCGKSCTNLLGGTCKLKLDPVSSISFGAQTCKRYKPLTPTSKNGIMSKEMRVFFELQRRALIQQLGALEDLLEMKRSLPKRKR